MSRLEEILGRPLLLSERHSVPTLNDLSPHMLAEAKGLMPHSWALVVRYLQFYVARSVEAADFVEEVLDRGADPATWGTHDVICIRNAELAALLRFTTLDVVEGLQAIDGDRWFRRPIVGDPAQNEVVGAPGVVVRNARYWWRKPDGVSAADVKAPLEQVAEADLPVAVRRWMALRMTWWAREYLAQGAPTFEGIVAALADSADVAPTNDARIAIAALLRELQTPGDGRPLGFRGPDEWYRSP